MKKAAENQKVIHRQGMNSAKIGKQKKASGKKRRMWITYAA